MASRTTAASPLFQPSSQCLRDLVLDYLVHNSYIDTARAFALDSAGLARAEKVLEGRADADDTAAKADEDQMNTADDDDDDANAPGSAELEAAGVSANILRLVRLRREIKHHILSGRVDEATQLLDAHFPSVLQESADGDEPPAPRAPAPHARVHYASQLSTKPVHIALNLRILAFVEAARTVPLPYPPDPRAKDASAAAPVPDRASDAFSAQQTALLHRAQGLYASVESLRDTRDRDVYRRELNSVGGLLAYPAPERSPMAKYMRQERREAVADQVNSAILYHQGQPATSHIELYARQTGAVWSVMRDNGMALPPLSQRPAGVAAPPGALREAPPLSTKTASKAEKAEAELVPLFDMQQFLDTP
ncbi:CTLH/CRA C-terminal to lish motif domain-containing protein [Phellopilus nigrolimitatus]|nr:CTLH/CRA C-terminal to lish motif domain-containing protein [Phellopilus nigrolimitatus]